MTKLVRGFEFTHDRMLDSNWQPSPGQRYTDAPKALMVVTRTTKRSVWYNVAGGNDGRRKVAPWVMDRDDFVARFLP